MEVVHDLVFLSDPLNTKARLCKAVAPSSFQQSLYGRLTRRRSTTALPLCSAAFFPGAPGAKLDGAGWQVCPAPFLCSIV